MTSITLSESFLSREAEQLFLKREFTHCLSLCNDGLIKYPDSSVLLYLRSLAQMQLHQYDEALEGLDRLIDDSHTPNPLYYRHRVEIEAKKNGPEAALQLLQEAFKLFSPSTTPLAGLHTQLLTECGNYGEAKQQLEKLFKSHPPEPQELTAYALICSKQGESKKAIPYLEKALKNLPSNLNAQKGLWFALAQLYDKQGDFTKAFDAATQGNQLDTASRDVSELKTLVQQVSKTWPASIYHELPNNQGKGENCIFIVGMPRSGSTLTEQILQTAPNVTGLGEVDWFKDAMAFIDPTLLKLHGFSDKPNRLTEKALSTIAKTYLDHLPKNADTIPLYSVDKNLFNSRLLGPISKALPKAKIIWCRRHPMDSILSCYFQNFGRINQQFNRLSNIVMQWHLTQQLMQHWTEELGIEVLGFDYEKLIDQPEEQSKRLLDFVGLPWSEDCLAFHRSKRITDTSSRHQVNQPLYSSSSGRWRNYEEQLRPAAKLLLSLGYEL